jgi:hypothetical protein
MRSRQCDLAAVAVHGWFQIAELCVAFFVGLDEVG